MSMAARAPLAYRILQEAVRILLGPVGAIGLAVLALIAGIATYAAFSDLLPAWIPTRQAVSGLLWIDLVIVLILGGLIVARITSMWIARKRGAAGSRLHARLVLLFSLVAVAPTVLVAAFSGYTLNASLQDWFTDRVRTSLDDALAVSDALLDERKMALEQDMAPIALTLRREGTDVLLNPDRLSQILTALSIQRRVSEVAVVDENGTPIARAHIFGASDEFYRPPLSAIQTAMNGNPLLLPREHDDRLSALLRLFRNETVFLYISQPIDARLLAEVNRVRSTVRYYDELEARQTDIQIRVAAVFVVIVVVMLLFAIWIGIAFAARLTEPITNLIGAAEKVRQGDLTVRVQEGRPDDEFGVLSRSFNRMTHQLSAQRHELIEANRQLDTRRRLTEAVLEGVSSGVISVDAAGIIELANRTALDLLGVRETTLFGSNIGELIPQIGEMLHTAGNRPDRVIQQEIELLRNGERRTLLVRVATERGDTTIDGFVVTFDDVTELLSAQRKAAWADVARRIAHEIKNPLTPIQLSAERLKRKYLKMITEDRETFVICTDTIVRQVGDIGRMVDEFSSFARMPRPVLQNEDLKEICQQAIFLQRTALPQINYRSILPDHATPLLCDRRQIGQVLTNLLKNAAEAIEGREKRDGVELPPGEITLRLTEAEDSITVDVEDNGKGLPREERSRLTEPYVTTRAKGTGLGLAIVKKIMEDHGGNLLLEDREGGGARIRLVFRHHVVAPGSSAGEAANAPRVKTASHGA